MAGTHKIRNGHTSHEFRPRERRLLVAHRKQEAAQEREGDQVPCICRTCGVVLGLVSISTELFCSDCGDWVGANDVVVAVEEMVR